MSTWDSILPLHLFLLPAFLQSRPTETQLRARVCTKVGREWRALSTYLNIPTTTVDKLLESHKHDVNEAFFRVLSVWREREGATWDQLLQAMRETGLNAPVRELQEWISSGAASVSCVVVIGREMHAETYYTLCDTGISRGKSLFYSFGWTHFLRVQGWIARSLLIQDMHLVA